MMELAGLGFKKSTTMRGAMNNSDIKNAKKSDICKELFKKINEEEKEEDGCNIAEQQQREYNEKEEEDA